MVIKMKIYTFIVGVFQTNSYIISSDKRNALVIDPGGEGEKLLQFLKETNLCLKKILLTHGHYDHTGSADFLRKNTGAEIFINEKDKILLSDGSINAAQLVPAIKYQPFAADFYINDKDEIILDEITFKVKVTPGHTAGSVVFIDEENRVIFSGDTLFHGTVGRTDLYSGNYNDIIESVKSLSKLTGDYKILAGHGEQTTLNTERRINPYI